MGTEEKTNTSGLGGSGEVVRLLHIDTIFAEGRGQVLHGKGVLAVLWEEGRPPSEHRNPRFQSLVGDPE